MNEKLLVVDVSGLAYRAFHSMRELSFEGLPTAVSYGVLRDVLYLRDLFYTNRFVFVFDRGKSLRNAIYPQYKEHRKDAITQDAEKVALRKSLRVQIRRFHDDVLPELGYRNVISAYGYESDDLMAKLCEDYPQQEMMLITSDHDMFQLLGKNVMMWSPSKKRVITAELFRADWGISPTQWADVLALAGCATDNVKGVHGVGPKTAIKFLRGDLVKGKAFEAIVNSNELWKSNLELVRLPFKGTPSWDLQDDDVTERRWSKVTRSLGITSLRY